MPAQDYQVSSEDGDKWEDACQEEDNINSFENSGNSDNASEWSSGVGGSGDAYEEGVATYLQTDESNVGGGDAFEAGADDMGEQAWQSGVAGAGDDWSDGCQGQGSEYVESASESQQEWFENYSDYYTDEA